ncbi:unnamed protein product [Chrysoparadoxa australica]
MGWFIDPADLPEGTDGGVQLCFLLVVYGYILFIASNMISDGSELLLLVPSMAGMVGSVVLPVLGAVPDGAIVLFSGMGDDAQNQLGVGVGALAGSTVMLLTLPWFLSVYAGRVNLDKETGQAVYRRPRWAKREWQKLSPPGNASLYRTGVTGSHDLAIGGALMMITALSYFIIQGAAFHLRHKPLDQVARGEQIFALSALIFCTVSFIAYLYYQWDRSQKHADEVLQDFIDEVHIEKVQNGDISLSALLKSEVLSAVESGHTSAAAARGSGYQAIPNTDGSTLLLPSDTMMHLQRLLRPFYHKYDMNGDGKLDLGELKSVFYEMGERHASQAELAALFAEFDQDKNGLVDFNEFCSGTAAYVHSVTTGGRRSMAVEMVELVEEEEGDENGVESSEEKEEIPEDLVDLPADVQQRRIIFRAAWTLVVGTALVVIFSDPMVDVLSEVGARTGIAPFYISFVLAPLASNASEVIASYSYALKKTTKTINISFSALQGAACMNNTFCLGVFMLLVYCRGLVWEFSAETTAILFVEVVVALISLKATHRLLDGLMVLTLYPLSLLLVYGLESIGWD